MSCKYPGSAKNLYALVVLWHPDLSWAYFSTNAKVKSGREVKSWEDTSFVESTTQQSSGVSVTNIGSQRCFEKNLFRKSELICGRFHMRLFREKTKPKSLYYEQFYNSHTFIRRHVVSPERPKSPLNTRKSSKIAKKDVLAVAFFACFYYF